MDHRLILRVDNAWLNRRLLIQRLSMYGPWADIAWGQRVFESCADMTEIRHTYGSCAPFSETRHISEPYVTHARWRCICMGHKPPLKRSTVYMYENLGLKRWAICVIIKDTRIHNMPCNQVGCNATWRRPVGLREGIAKIGYVCFLLTLKHWLLVFTSY